MDYVLEVENVRKTFRLSRKQQKIDKTGKLLVAADGISFKAAAGEIYGLLGPNGAGKTTVMRMISTLINCDEGDVKIYGKSIKTDAGEVRRHISFLTGELKFEDFFTPDFLFGFYSDLHGVAPAERERRKEFLFDKFGIRPFRAVKVKDLSTGMKQKVSIAISLAHDPGVIVYDEPTNGLDIITAKIVTDFLLDLKKQGKCVIVSTHIFSLVEKVCDRVGIIIKGKMVKEGALADVQDGKTLEDAFFDIYGKTVNAEAAV